MENQKKAAAVGMLVAKRQGIGNHPLAHLIEGHYGMEKSCYPEEFREIGEAYSDVKARNAQIERAKEAVFTLHSTPISDISIRLDINMRGRWLSIDEVFEKVRTHNAIAPIIEQNGEDAVRELIKARIDEGNDNREHFRFDLYSSNVGRDEAIGIVEIMQKALPVGDVSSVARQLRSMADAIEAQAAEPAR